MGVLVSIGTDGVTDWVSLPDGQRYNLGPVSALRFVMSLSGGSRQAKQVLSRYLEHGEALLAVDEGKLWELLKPVRARWASNSAFMSLDHGYQPHTTRKEMPTIFDNLARTHKVIQYLNKQAAGGQKDPKAYEYLTREAGKIKSPNQSDNSTYYNLGKPDVFEVGDSAPKPHTVTASDNDFGAKVGSLNLDTYEANMKLAQLVLDQSQQTVTTIRAKAAAGKKFQASRALADVHAVTSRVASICEGTQLVEAWVRPDLQKLARRSDELHKLFHPKA